MKRLISFIMLGASVLGVHASMMAPPMPPNTNDWALYALADHARALDTKLGYTDGKVDALQRQMDHMETGFMFLVLVVVIAVIAICVLVARRSTGTVVRATAQETCESAGAVEATATAKTEAKK